jgi:hypothetical protein
MIMKRIIILVCCLLSCCVTYAQQEASRKVSAETLFNEIISSHTKEKLTFENATPEGAVTNSIMQLLNLKQALNALKDTDITVAILLNRIDQALQILSTRRIYKYQLWAEKQLRRSPEADKLKKLSGNEKIAYYLELSRVMQDLVTENMLRREIVSRLADIYNALEEKEKKFVRGEAIKMQQDDYSAALDEKQRRRRMILEDF